MASSDAVSGCMRVGCVVVRGCGPHPRVIRCTDPRVHAVRAGKGVTLVHDGRVERVRQLDLADRAAAGGWLGAAADRCIERRVGEGCGVHGESFVRCAVGHLNQRVVQQCMNQFAGRCDECHPRRRPVRRRDGQQPMWHPKVDAAIGQEMPRSIVDPDLLALPRSIRLRSGRERHVAGARSGALRIDDRDPRATLGKGPRAPGAGKACPQDRHALGVRRWGWCEPRLDARGCGSRATSRHRHVPLGVEAGHALHIEARRVEPRPNGTCG